MNGRNKAKLNDFVNHNFFEARCMWTLCMRTITIQTMKTLSNLWTLRELCGHLENLSILKIFSEDYATDYYKQFKDIFQNFQDFLKCL